MTSAYWLGRSQPAAGADRVQGKARVLEPMGVLPPMLRAVLEATDARAREAAWAMFVQQYTPLLLHVCYRFGHTYDEAMDRYSHLLEQLDANDFGRLRAFAANGPGRFSTWLVVVARRLLLDYHRHRFGRRRPSSGKRADATANSSLIRWRLVELASEDLPASAEVASAAPDPEAAAQAAERKAVVRAALQCLEPRDQLLLRLRFDKDLTAQEIAKIMGFQTQFEVYRRLRTVLARVGRLLPQAYRELAS
jgi:RNA polymerase sigma factor (sigma-70 family)